MRVVYLAETLDGGLMKIGTTEDLNHRYDGLNRVARENFGQSIHFVAAMPGGFDVERELVRKYCLAAVRGREWFMPMPELLGEFAGKEIDLASVPVYFCRHGVRLCGCSHKNGVIWDWETAEIAKKSASARWSRMVTQKGGK